MTGASAHALTDPANLYTIESLKKAGISGWPVVEDTTILLPIYSLAKNTNGDIVSVVYAIMEVVKMVHTSYLVTTIPGTVSVCVCVCVRGKEC